MNRQKTINIELIEENEGQIDGLPANPRICKGEKFDRLVKSIEDNPEMLTLRPLMVFPHDGKYVAIGGNMRLKALKKMGYKEIPIVEIPPTATAEQLRAYAIKDNETFGEWDWDMLANEWDSEELAAFGMNVWEQNDSKDNVRDSFEKEFNSINDKNCELPIVPEFFEHHECFVIVTHNDIDEQYIRDIFGLNGNFASNSGDKKVRKANVISVENIKKILEK